ncbi:MAG: hypothetical protein AAGC60_09210 [Acidobacteriota bacterium]
MSTPSEPWRDALSAVSRERAARAPEVTVAELVAYRRGRLAEDDANRVREALAAQASLRALYAAVPADDPEPVVDDPEVDAAVAWLREQSEGADRVVAIDTRRSGTPWRTVLATAALALVAVATVFVFGPGAENPRFELVFGVQDEGVRGGGPTVKTIEVEPTRPFVLVVPDDLLDDGSWQVKLCGPIQHVPNRPDCDDPILKHPVDAEHREVEVGPLDAGYYVVLVEETEGAKFHSMVLEVVLDDDR